MFRLPTQIVLKYVISSIPKNWPSRQVGEWTWTQDQKPSNVGSGVGKDAPSLEIGEKMGRPDVNMGKSSGACALLLRK